MHIGVKLTGLLCAGSAVAQVAVPETGEQAMTHGLGLALLALALPVLGFLMHRAISQNDESIKGVGAKVDKFIEAHGKLDKEVALVKQDHEAVKADVVELQKWAQGHRR